MKVFVTGASGYVGFNVASALRRAGHKVWGLVRSEEKVKRLLKHEIHPVLGTLQEPDNYKGIAELWCTWMIWRMFMCARRRAA